jgi:hypothetical protein
MVIIYIVLCFILLYIVFFQNKILENYQDVVPKEFNEDILINEKLAVGKEIANYKLDVQNNIYAKEFCLRDEQGNHTCINRKDMRGIHQEPNYDKREICIGDTCINKHDIIVLKNMSQDTEQDVDLNAKMFKNKSTGFIKDDTDAFKTNDITVFKNNAKCSKDLINERYTKETDLENYNKVSLGIVQNKEECAKKCIKESKKCGSDSSDRTYRHNNEVLNDHLCKNISLEKKDLDSNYTCYWNRGPCTRTEYDKNSTIYQVNKYPGSDYKKNNNRLKQANNFMDDLRLRSRVKMNFHSGGHFGDCTGGLDDFFYYGENYSKKPSRFDKYNDPKTSTNGIFLHTFIT